MEKNFSGVIQRIDDLGRITIPRELRRKLKVNEGDAFEIGIAPLQGKESFYLTPYSPIEASLLRQLETALTAMARQIPEGYEVGILDESGPIASTCTGQQAKAVNTWGTLENDAHWIFEEFRTIGRYGYREINGKDMLAYPVRSYNEVLLVLGIIGIDVQDAESGIVRASAAVMSAMLS